MGKIPCPLPCQSKKQSTYIHSDSSSSSALSSQPSLPSVPSLTPPSPQTQLFSNICASTFKAHSSIFCLSITGKQFYTGTSNGEILLCNIDLLNQQNNPIVVAQSTSSVKSIVISGDKLFSAHQDHKIRVWKIDTYDQTYKCIATLPTLNDRCMRLFSAKNYVEVRRHKKCTWVHHVDTVSALALSSDGSLLYSASWDRTFKVWRTSDFKCLESVWNAHDDAINAIALSKNGYVYTGSADMRIKVWKREEGEKKLHTLVATLEKHKSAVNALALSTDGSVLYSGACDRSIIVWEKDSGGNGKMVVSGALRGHTKAILCLAVVADLVCSGSADKTVRIWKKGIGKGYSCLAVLEGHNGPVKCLTAALDNNSSKTKDDSGCGSSCVVYSGSLDCDIKVWKIWVPCL
ncbi:protein JINGUBANG-like [Lycium ferocissimum]|uniref:protein JINGUBANG-like n=1 Tax=Lycium ferocissimum TaxID=112874 RepID=UPI002816820E|nr:protein JINGUBANG-like [Lycium ferocissimum]